MDDDKLVVGDVQFRNEDALGLFAFETRNEVFEDRNGLALGNRIAESAVEVDIANGYTQLVGTKIDGLIGRKSNGVGQALVDDKALVEVLLDLIIVVILFEFLR